MSNALEQLTAQSLTLATENGRKKGTATLVHCRVGVSRSATICIAEVMNELGLSFPRAYCFVRARRLNVIIQPHLRFWYVPSSPRGLDFTDVPIVMNS